MRGSGTLVAIAATLHACVQSMVGQLASLGMAASVALTGLFTAAWPMLVGLVGPLCVQWRCRGMAHAIRDRPLRQRRCSDPVAYHLWADSALLGPSAFAFLLRPTDGYGGGWVLCAVAALCVGISLMCPFSLAEAGEAFMAKTAGEDYPEPSGQAQGAQISRARGSIRASDREEGFSGIHSELPYRVRAPREVQRPGRRLLLDILPKFRIVGQRAP
jgi:hypothetical protein